MADCDQEDGATPVRDIASDACLPGQCKIVLHEAHFMPLRSPSNVYGLVSLCLDGSNKLVVTTLRGEVYCLEFYDPLAQPQRPPSFKSITLSYIPGTHIRGVWIYDDYTLSHLIVGVEVISMDAIVKEPNGVIIGMTLVKVCSPVVCARVTIIVNEHSERTYRSVYRDFAICFISMS